MALCGDIYKLGAGAERVKLKIKLRYSAMLATDYKCYISTSLNRKLNSVFQLSGLP